MSERGLRCEVVKDWGRNEPEKGRDKCGKGLDGNCMLRVVVELGLLRGRFENALMEL